MKCVVASTFAVIAMTTSCASTGYDKNCPMPPACPTCGPSPGPATTAIGWMGVAGKYCLVEFGAGLGADAQKVSTWVDAAGDALKDELGAMSNFAFMDTTCRVHVVGFRTELAKEGKASAWPEDRGDQHSADLFFLAPSLHDPDAKSSANEPQDDDYLQKNVVHELAHVVLRGIVRHEPGGLDAHTFPSWFWEGYAEYLALVRSNDKSKTIVFRKYLEMVRADPTRVKIGKTIEVRDVYVDGSMLVAFLKQELGYQRFPSMLLGGGKPTFDESLDVATGVDRAKLAAKFSAWLQKQP